MRAPAGLRATGNRAWHGASGKNEVTEKIHRALFGRLDSVDPAAIVERVARLEAKLQALMELREPLLRAGTLEIDLIKRAPGAASDQLNCCLGNSDCWNT